MTDPKLNDRVPSASRQDCLSRMQPKGPRPESRSHLRFPIEDSSANLFLKGFFTLMSLGRRNKARSAINLSEGGLMLLLREPVPRESKVIVRIEMEKYSDVIEAVGEVRWCTQSARSDQDHYAGIQFIGLGPGELKKIGQMREWFNSPEYRIRMATRRRSESL